MRIRTFTAATTQAAMALVRNEMGPAAVIIAIDQAARGQGVVVRAAVDDDLPAAAPTAPMPPVEDRLEAFLKARLTGPLAFGHAA
jgi:flagellar biosynthesis GTPase FlhF